MAYASLSLNRCQLTLDRSQWVLNLRSILYVILVLCALASLQDFKGTPSAGALNVRELGKFSKYTVAVFSKTVTRYIGPYRSYTMDH